MKRPTHFMRCQFTLRRLLLISLAFGVIAANHQRQVSIAKEVAIREKLALNSLPDDPHVDYDRIVPFGVIRALVTDLSIFDRVVAYGPPVEPLDNAAPLAVLQRLRYLNLSYTPFEDDNLRMAFPLQTLNTLRLDGTYTSDAFIDSLRDCDQLTHLSLSYTDVSSQGIAKLCRLRPKLRELALAGLDVSDDDVGRISQRFTRLERLDLSDTSITAGCLGYLSRLPFLRELDLSETGVRISSQIRGRLKTAHDDF